MNKKRFWDWANDKDENGRILRIEGIIAEETWLGDEITPKQFRSELFKNVTTRNSKQY